VTPAEPRPAASVLLVRPGKGPPLEVYMIRRQKSMRFLGGFYAFPGGKVDPGDALPALHGRCRGLDPAEAGRAIPSAADMPALAYWVAAARELFEETGVLVAQDEGGRSIDVDDRSVAERVEAIRTGVIAAPGTLDALLAAEGWYLDLAPLRYLSHFITPPSSPIRFSARFFLAPVPSGQRAHLHEAEASEGFWIAPSEAYRRWGLGEMPMAEPAYSGLAYLSEFDSLDALWAAHADNRHKIHGINDRLDAAGLRVPRRAPGAAGTP
jgi:endoribonuclease LACTB2